MASKILPFSSEVQEKVQTIRDTVHSPNDLAMAAVKLDDGKGRGRRVARALGVNQGRYQRAFLIFRFAPDLIEKIENGEIAISKASQIACDRQQNKTSNVVKIRPEGSFTSSSVRDSSIQKAVENAFLLAIETLCGLPRPEDVAEIAKRNRKIRSKVESASNWLKEFSNVYL